MQLGTFGDLLIGNDNVDARLTKADEPGNQLGGFDFRWAGKPMNHPGAIYAQIIGEDESGGLPSRLFGMGGIETWGGWRGSAASWRAFLEYADTTVGLWSARTFCNAAYNHHIYRSGYRYRGKSLGHGMDNDSRILTLGLLLSDRNAYGWQLTARHADLNRDDAGLNPFSPRRTKYSSLALRHERPLYAGQVTVDVGLHHTRLVAEDSNETDPSLALMWEKGW